MTTETGSKGAGGPALFIGAVHQSRVIAFVAAHILAGSRLQWLEGFDDTPTAVWGETSGPGDDIRIEFGDNTPVVEAQAKHGLHAGKELESAIRAVAASPLRDVPVVFVLDESSSQRVRRKVADDLSNIRAGRTDALSKTTQDLLSNGIEEDLLRRITIVQCDVDHPFDAGVAQAREKLEQVLVDPRQSATAWDTLCADAAEVSARRRRRDRPDLVGILAGRGIVVKAIGPDAVWEDQLDISKLIIERRQFAPALKHLREVEAKIKTRDAGPHVWFRLHHQRAVIFYYTERPDEAKASARLASAREPTNVAPWLLRTRIAAAEKSVEEAKEHAARALELAYEDPAAWSAVAEANAAAGEPLPDPPPAVRSKRSYRLDVCAILRRRADWDGVVRLSDELLPFGREPELLLLRAQALGTLADEGAPGREQKYRDAIDLTTEAIEEVDDETNPLTRTARALRVSAKSGLGTLRSDDEDVTTLRREHPNDPEVLKMVATTYVQTERTPDRALQVLGHPVAETSAPLLAMRAHLRAVKRERDVARRDLDTVETLLASKENLDARIAAVSAALALGDVARAMRLLETVRQDAPSGPFLIVRGQVAIANGDYDSGEADIRAAAALRPAGRVQILTLLAEQLLERGAPDRAIRILDEIGNALMPDSRQTLVRALMAAHDLERAAREVDTALLETPPPVWALGIGADLALRQADPRRAADLLKKLIASGAAAPSARIQLALILIQLGRIREADPYLDELRADPSLPPLQQIRTAYLLMLGGRTDEAVRFGFAAARRAPQDPEVQKGFTALYFNSRAELLPPKEVAADVHVLLTNAAGARREYMIVGSEPYDAARNRISVEEARTRRLLGLRVGGVQVDNPGMGYLEERWTVISLTPAAAQLAHQTASRFHDLFPDQPFFSRAFQYSGAALTDFLPFIQSMEANRKQIGNVLSVYREDLPPLGLIAEWLHVSIADVIGNLALERSISAVHVEWLDAPGRSSSRAAARNAKRVVITRSALATAQQLDLLDTVASEYDLVAPTSLEQELADEVRHAEEEAEKGWHRVVPAETTGFELKEIPASDELLVRRRDALRTLVRWARDHVDFHARPMATVGAENSEGEQARPAMGASTYDSLALADHEAITIYADDLGLRRFSLAGGPRPASFSTVALLDAFVERGALAPTDRDAHLLKLASAKYATIAPTPDLLALALRRSEADMEVAFGLLAQSALPLADAARIGAAAIRRAKEAAIVRQRTTEVARRVLRALGKAYPLRAAAAALYAASQAPLRFLPEDLEAVKDVCSSAVAASFDLPGDTGGAREWLLDRQG